MEKTDLTISEIYKSCGGLDKVAIACKVHLSTPEKWKKNGMPDKYWSTIFSISERDLTANDCFAANEAIRNSSS